MVAYFVYANGTALSSNEVENMLSDPDHYPSLADLGLMYIVSSNCLVCHLSVILYFLYIPSCSSQVWTNFP